MKLVVGCLAIMMSAWASANVHDVRIWPAPQAGTRVVLDITRPLEHKVFNLENPARIVIDLTDAQVLKPLESVKVEGTVIRTIRSARHGNNARLVIELNESMGFKSFALPPNELYGNRIVIDLEHKNAVQVSAPVPVKQLDDVKVRQRDVVIVIDAGHGGEDPGAIGPGRIMEKHVVLAIARELQKLLDKEPGYKAILVRTGDYYVGLKERSEAARKANADLFISVHADAFKYASAHGSSVFMLSERGASSEMARWLADKENRSDLIGGVTLKDKEDHVRQTLLDLSLTNKSNESARLGGHILEHMGKISRLHKPHVEEAAFAVLRGPEVPALLIETGFISNPQEAKKLAEKGYQQKMAQAIFSGIHRYFSDNPPDDTWLAAQRSTPASTARAPREHWVRNGDTLSGIAARYSVSMAELRKANNIKNDQLRSGQKLLIP